jgi:hypothetical protein
MGGGPCGPVCGPPGATSPSRPLHPLHLKRSMGRFMSPARTLRLWALVEGEAKRDPVLRAQGLRPMHLWEVHK